jgi:hypothetical protein
MGQLVDHAGVISKKVTMAHCLMLHKSISTDFSLLSENKLSAYEGVFPGLLGHNQSNSEERIRES